MFFICLRYYEGMFRKANFLPRPDMRAHSPKSLNGNRFAGIFFFFALVGGLFFIPGELQSKTAGPCVAAGTWRNPAAKEARLGRLDYRRLIKRLAKKPVVMLGETHDRADHHRWQLQVIGALFGRNQNMVLGFEAFPRSVQPVLDRWTRGGLDEKTFLKQSRWREVWNFDADLYMPIFNFARLNRIPMIALNVERTLIDEVGENGWAAIPASKRQGIGDPAAAEDAYFESLYQTYKSHPVVKGKTRGGKNSPAFRRFVDAQLTWDRAMAEKLADVRRGGGEALVVGIIGRGHLEYGYGVPRQLKNLGVKGSAVLLPWDRAESCETLRSNGRPVADAVFGMAATVASAKTKKAKLGVYLETASGTEGGAKILGVATASVAEAAGLAAGDIVFSAAGEAVAGAPELAAIVRRQAPGTWLPLRVRRKQETIDVIAKFPPGKK